MNIPFWEPLPSTRGILNAKRTAPAWTAEELGKRTSIERFFGLQRPPLSSWTSIVSQIALTYTAPIIVALAAQQTGCPDLIRSPSAFWLTCGRVYE